MKRKGEFAKLAATWFYSGLAPKAPGTFGSLATLPFAYAAVYWGGTIALLGFAVMVFALGLLVAGTYARQLKRQDPGCIVIDEVCGQSLALIGAGTSPVLFLLGFFLFRLFDISKPWPVSWADSKLKGALGIMLDDVFAGLMAAAVLNVLRIFGESL